MLPTFLPFSLSSFFQPPPFFSLYPFSIHILIVVSSFFVPFYPLLIISLLGWLSFRAVNSSIPPADPFPDLPCPAVLLGISL